MLVVVFVFSPIKEVRNFNKYYKDLYIVDSLKGPNSKTD